MTQKGKIILAEIKGDHLQNDDSRNKIELDKEWASQAGNQFRYYMVFRDNDNILPGAICINNFIATIKEL